MGNLVFQITWRVSLSHGLTENCVSIIKSIQGTLISYFIKILNYRLGEILKGHTEINAGRDD